MLYELILCCICGGMSLLYRRLYDEGLTNPGFGGEVLRVDGCCCILFTGESDQPDTVRQLLLDEIERVRKEGVDREIFTLCKNENTASSSKIWKTWRTRPARWQISRWQARLWPSRSPCWRV